MPLHSPPGVSSPRGLDLPPECLPASKHLAVQLSWELSLCTYKALPSLGRGSAGGQGPYRT